MEEKQRTFSFFDETGNKIFGSEYEIEIKKDLKKKLRSFSLMGSVDRLDSP